MAWKTVPYLHLAVEVYADSSSVISRSD